mmetsp:Transcript_54745/g.138710  ORF Transcript_54745/g.138710 Transcript_54745/m.138710 type:complete len:310 (+) Transcript_54745:674-1603(+)
MQLEVHVAYGVGAIPDRCSTHGVRSGGDRFHVKVLAGVVLHRAEADNGEAVASLLDGLDDILGPQRLVGAITGLHRHQGLGWVQAVEPDLRLEGEKVRAEGVRLVEDLRPRALRSVEGNQQQVQIHREAVHVGDLRRQRAHNRRRAIHDQLVDGQPLRLPPREVPVHAELGPTVELRIDVLTSLAGLQPEGVAYEVHAVVVQVGHLGVRRHCALFRDAEGGALGRGQRGELGVQGRGQGLGVQADPLLRGGRPQDLQDIRGRAILLVRGEVPERSAVQRRDRHRWCRHASPTIPAAAQLEQHSSPTAIP